MSAERLPVVEALRRCLSSNLPAQRAKALRTIAASLEAQEVEKERLQRQTMIDACHVRTAKRAIAAMRELRYEYRVILPQLMRGICGRGCCRPPWRRNPITEYEVTHWPDGSPIIPRLGHRREDHPWGPPDDGPTELTGGAEHV